MDPAIIQSIAAFVGGAADLLRMSMVCKAWRECLCADVHTHAVEHIWLRAALHANPSLGTVLLPIVDRQFYAAQSPDRSETASGSAVRAPVSSGTHAHARTHTRGDLETLVHSARMAVQCNFLAREIALAAATDISSRPIFDADVAALGHAGARAFCECVHTLTHTLPRTVPRTHAIAHTDAHAHTPLREHAVANSHAATAAHAVGDDTHATSDGGCAPAADAAAAEACVSARYWAWRFARTCGLEASVIDLRRALSGLQCVTGQSDCAGEGAQAPQVRVRIEDGSIALTRVFKPWLNELAVRLAIASIGMWIRARALRAIRGRPLLDGDTSVRLRQAAEKIWDAAVAALADDNARFDLAQWGRAQLPTAASGITNGLLDSASALIPPTAGEVAELANAMSDETLSMAVLEAAASVFTTDLGFSGTRTDYNEVESSLIDEVLLRRTGLPISLSVLFVAACREAGITAVRPAGLPGHFYASVHRTMGGPLLVDTFHDCEVVDLAARLEVDLGTIPEHVINTPLPSVWMRICVNVARITAQGRREYRAKLGWLMAQLEDEGEFARGTEPSVFHETQPQLDILASFSRMQREHARRATRITQPRFRDAFNARVASASTLSPLLHRAVLSQRLYHLEPRALLECVGVLADEVYADALPEPHDLRKSPMFGTWRACVSHAPVSCQRGDADLPTSGAPVTWPDGLIMTPGTLVSFPALAPAANQFHGVVVGWTSRSAVPAVESSSIRLSLFDSQVSPWQSRWQRAPQLHELYVLVLSHPDLRAIDAADVHQVAQDMVRVLEPEEVTALGQSMLAAATLRFIVPPWVAACSGTTPTEAGSHVTLAAELRAVFGERHAV